MKTPDMPHTDEICRVAQLYIGPNREPWIIGKVDPIKSYQLLEQILTEKNLPIQRIPVKSGEEDVMIPSLESPNGEYNVVGLGSCVKISGKYHFLEEFDSESLIYGNVGVDENHLKAFQQLNPEFKYEIHRKDPPRPGPRLVPTIKAQ